MTSRIGIDYNLAIHDGISIWLPPWSAGDDKYGSQVIPDLYAIGTGQQWPTGTILRKGLRTFIYSKTDATYFGEKVGGSNLAIGAGYFMESAAERLDKVNSVTAGVAGENTISVTTSASVLVNAYAGGFIGIKQAAGNRQTAGRYSTYEILSNLVEASNVTKFTLDGNLVNGYASGDDVVLTENPYAICRHPQGGPYGMAIGILVVTTVASSFLWLQTGGPHNMVHPNATFEGANAYETEYYLFAGNGNIAVETDTTILGTTEITAMQHVGSRYASSDISGPGGSPANSTIAESVFLKIFN